jgi:hypothetical protein
MLDDWFSCDRFVPSGSEVYKELQVLFDSDFIPSFEKYPLTCTCSSSGCQIHGPVRLAEDLTALAVNARHQSDQNMMDLVEACRKKNGFEIILLEAASRPGKKG